MTLEELLLAGGGLAGVVLLLVKIKPLEIKPWAAIGKAVSRAINGEVLGELAQIRATQLKTQTDLEDHIKVDDERNADAHRQTILRFNNELLRDIPHTREDFIEILAEIDAYERYCHDHPEYENNRAVHAIANIGRVYDERLSKHDFL